MHGPEVDLGLAAAGDALEEDGRELRFAQGHRDLGIGLRLLGREDALLEGGGAKRATLIGPPLRNLEADGHETLLLEGLQGLASRGHVAHEVAHRRGTPAFLEQGRNFERAALQFRRLEAGLRGRHLNALKVRGREFHLELDQADLVEFEQARRDVLVESGGEGRDRHLPSPVSQGLQNRVGRRGDETRGRGGVLEADDALRSAHAAGRSHEPRGLADGTDVVVGDP